MNPFTKYPLLSRYKAVRAGIVREVVAMTGCAKAVVSRTFSGDTKTPKPHLVKALNGWLAMNGFPTVDSRGRTERRTFVPATRSTTIRKSSTE